MLNAELAWQGDGPVATFPPSVSYQKRFLTLQREAGAANRWLWGTQ